MAKGGANVYAGHIKNIREYLIECGLESNDKEPIETLLQQCHANNNNNNEVRPFGNDFQSKSELSRRIDEEGLIQHHSVRSLNKRFSMLDLWTLLKRTMRQTYLSQWHILLMQTVFYLSGALIMKFHFTSKMVEPDGCLDIGFSDFVNNCNHTLEDLNNDYLIKQIMKYIYVTAIVLSTIMTVFVIVPFLDEIKVIENEYNNCK